MNIAIVVSSQLTLTSFLQALIMRLSEHHKVTIIFNADADLQPWMSSYGLTVKPIKIVRNISLWNDVKSLFILFSYFRKNEFDLVYSVTPKAGLLATTAGYFSGVKHRIHIFTGQVWVTKTGIMRNVLKSMDRITANFASKLLADSYSQREFLIDEGVVKPNKIKVLANGSISGVNLKRFFPNITTRANVRLELNIDNNDVVFLFLGRLDPDKGVEDLLAAFKLLVDQHKNVKLVIVGPDEANMREKIMLNIASSSDFVRFVDFTSNPESYMNAADVLCLPSYREGFGSVVIEAAAVGIPSIGSNIYGIRDAIVDKVTGCLFPVHKVEALFEAMQTMVLDEKVRKQFGDSAKQRATDQFSQEFVTASFTHYFEEILNSGRA